MKPRILLLLILFVVSSGVAYRTLTAPTARHNINLPVAVAPSRPDDSPQPESPEEKRRRLIPGVWQDEYQGKRTMTLNKDGTGTMVVELKGVQASLFADKLRFDMTWSLEDDKLVKTTIGGEPAKKVNLVLKMMGDTAADTILEITGDRLLLLDKDGATEYDWKRVPQNKPSEE
jgi:hypothetical protein